MLIGDLFMDVLLQCAHEFENLLDVKYRIQLAKKGKLNDFELHFSKTEFYHLIGLQKLTDIPSLRADRDTVFDKIIDGKIKYDDIKKSSYFGYIRDRVHGFIYIQEILDSTYTTFRYSQKKNIFSKIDAEYLLDCSIDNKTFYLFIDELQDQNIKYCRSFFPKVDKDYTQNQTKLTLLYKEKINVKQKNKSAILFGKLR